MTCRERCIICERVTVKMVGGNVCADCAIRTPEAELRERCGYRWKAPLDRPLLQRMAIYAGILDSGMRIFEPTPEVLS